MFFGFPMEKLQGRGPLPPLVGGCRKYPPFPQKPPFFVGFCRVGFCKVVSAGVFCRVSAKRPRFPQCFCTFFVQEIARFLRQVSGKPLQNHGTLFQQLTIVQMQHANLVGMVHLGDNMCSNAQNSLCAPKQHQLVVFQVASKTIFLKTVNFANQPRFFKWQKCTFVIMHIDGITASAICGVDLGLKLYI